MKWHKIARNKIERFQNRFVGYLTQPEVLYLTSIGCKISDPEKMKIFAEMSEEGIIRATWVYFDSVTFRVTKKWKSSFD